MLLVNWECFNHEDDKDEVDREMTMFVIIILKGNKIIIQDDRRWSFY